MSDSLDRVDERLSWAYKHLERFDSERLVYMNSRPYSARTEANPDGVTFDWYVDGVTNQPPLRLSLIAGDCIHNARAALDNLAFALCEAFTPTFNAARPEFPIFESSSGYTTHGKNKIIDADPRAEAVIEGLQPYNSSSKAFLPYPVSSAEPYSADRHPLWVLYCLSNSDKHRLPNMTVSKIVGHNLVNPRGATVTMSPSTGPLEVGTHLGQVVYSVAPEPSGGEMRPAFLPNVSFKDPPAAIWPGHYYMLKILDFIRDDVIPPLRTFL